jgi:hypothetical protein
MSELQFMPSLLLRICSLEPEELARYASGLAA